MTAHAQYTGPSTAGINLERIDLTAQYPQGLVVEGRTALGHPAKYMYVKFVDAVTYAAAKVVYLASATTMDVTNDVSGGSALANAWPVGMTFWAGDVATQNTYGWIQITGIATFTAGSASIIAGDLLKCDSSEDGDCDEATAGTDENLVGVALATVADNATGLCRLIIRGY